MLSNRPLLVPALAALASLTLQSGCSSTTDGSSAAPAATASPSPGGAPAGGPGGQEAMRGTFGLIAEVRGSTLQVQGDDAQTAVTFTENTAFTQQTTGSIADVVAGVCVTGSGEGSEDAGATTVTRLSISAPVDGRCQAMGGGGWPGGPGEGLAPPSGAPSGAPSDLPSGMAGGPGALVSGLVASVDGNTVTVTGRDDATSTFTLGEDAVVTTTIPATSADALAGMCALAEGDTDDSGAVTATSIQLSPASDGECSRGGRR